MIGRSGQQFGAQKQLGWKGPALMELKVEKEKGCLLSRLFVMASRMGKIRPFFWMLSM
jgi:hypothetical protein